MIFQFYNILANLRFFLQKITAYFHNISHFCKKNYA